MAEDESGKKNETPATAAADELSEESSKTIKFHYIKSNSFRVIHVDGVLGGPAPKRQLWMHFYNERPAIPQQQVYPLNSNGTLGPEIKSSRVSRQGLVREIEAALVLDLPAARNLHKWLGQKIGELEQLIKVGSDLIAAKNPKKDT